MIRPTRFAHLSRFRRAAFALFLVAGMGSTGTALPFTAPTAMSQPLPNLSLEPPDVREGQELSAGEPVEVCFVWSLRGADAGPFNLQLKVDGVVQGERRFPGTGSPFSALSCFRLTEAAGAHVVQALVDVDNEIDESDEADNIASQTLSWAGPNLSLDPPSVREGQALSAGEPAEVCFVWSLRGADAGPFNLQLEVDGVVRGERRFPGTGNPFSALSCFSLTEAAGAHVVQALVDVDNEIDESDEADNIASQTLSWADSNQPLISRPSLADPELEVEPLVANRMPSFPELGIPPTAPTLPNVRIDPTLSLVNLDGPGNVTGGQRAELCLGWEVHDLAVSPFNVQLKVDGAVRGEQAVDGLVGTGNECFVITEAAGPHLLEGITDADNEIAESNESDNSKTWNFTWAESTTAPPSAPQGPRPDLLISSLEFEDHRCEPGRNRITAFVRNAGDGPAGRFAVRLWVDDQEQDSEAIDDLDPGDDHQVRFSRINLDAGLRRIRVMTDATEDILESNERNNELFAVANCAAPQADLVVTSVEVDDNDCDPGRNRIEAVVANEGPGRARQFEVRLWIGSELRASETIDDLDPGDQKRVRFGRIELSQGQQDLRVKADADDEVTESNENNNERSTRVNCVQES